MGIFNKDEKEEAVVVPEAATPEAKVKPVVAAPEFVDRSLYNCDACGGEGLLLDEGNKTYVHCPQCQGKGKLN